MTSPESKTASCQSVFSIIIPTFNRARLLIEALESVKAQSYRPLEIIVVDDGSTDETYNALRNWVKLNNESADLAVRYIYQNNSGASSARNRGIQEIGGKYVQFFDSDDRMHPERLSVLADAFERENADFIQTGFDGFDPVTGETVQTNYGKADQDQFELALIGRFWANTLRAALTADLVRKIGPWKTDMCCFEDREYMERAVAMAEKPIAIKDVLASARRGGGVRVSDKLRTYEGRKCRIYCERKLAEHLAEKPDVQDSAKSEFVSRIYALGFRSNAEGWLDLGRECGEIVKGIAVDLDFKGKQRYLIWRSGRLGGWLFLRLAGIFKR